MSLLRKYSSIRIPVERFRSTGISARRLAMAFFAVAVTLAAYAPRVESQWKLQQDFASYAPDFLRITSIYFLDLPGPPRIGFLGAASIDSGQLWKTTNGGASWYEVRIANEIDFDGVYDFAFKDSLTGWLVEYDDPWGLDACYKTTDGGETWNALPGTGDPGYTTEGGYSIYYHRATNRLFLASDEDFVLGLTSTDEGVTWQSMNLQFSSSSFSDDSTGILTGYPSSNGFSNQIFDNFTTDGGKTWTTTNYWYFATHPLPIWGTKTFFLLTDSDQVYRSDDGGKTWTLISIVSGGGIGLPGDLYGDLNQMYTQTVTGVFVSKDEGLSWQDLCGPGARGAYEHIGFYARGNYVYAAETGDGYGYGAPCKLWYLNTDSLNIFTSSLHPTQSTASGNGMSVLFQPQIDSTVGVDTAHFAIRYDSSLLLQSLQLPAGWNLLDSSSNGNTLNVTIFDTSSVVSNPNVTLTFEPILTPSISSGKVWLDSANLSGKWMNCDISAQSTSAPDSVQLDFTGCGDSLILAAMEHTPPFAIQSIVPNPAQNSLRVEGNGQGVTAELDDALGRAVVPVTLYPLPVTLDVHSLPSGIYYLRFSSNGYVETRSISIAR